MSSQKNTVNINSLLNFHNNSLGVITHLLITVIIFVFWQAASFGFQLIHALINGKGLSYIMIENNYYGIELGAMFGSFYTILLIMVVVEYLYKENSLSYLNINLASWLKTFEYILIFIIWMLSITFIAEKFDLNTLKEGDEFAKSLINEGNPILLILAIGIIGPIFEEIFFRGFLFKHLEIKWGGAKTVIFTSIIFTIMHIQYNLFILGLVLFPMAMLLGYARLKTKSLMAPIIIHCLNNTLTVLITIYEI